MSIVTARTPSLAVAIAALAASLALALAPHALAQPPKDAAKEAPKAAAPPQQGAIPVPQPEVLLVLIRSAMIGLDHANRTGNYSVLREMGGPALQQLSTAQLSNAFVNLRNAKVDLLPAAIATPQLVQQPAVTPQGLLQLVGFFPTQPRRIEFNIVYQVAGGQWKLAGINAGLGQAPQANANVGQAPQGNGGPDAKAAPGAAPAAKPKATAPAKK